MPLAGPHLEGPIDPRDVLGRGLAACPDATAISDAEGLLTWRELDFASRRLAASWLALGLEPGDRVASLMPNRTAVVLHYLACVRAGLVCTPLNYRYQAPEMDHALEVSGARVLLVHAEREADVAESRLARELPLCVVRYGDPSGSGPSFEALVESGATDAELPRVEASTPAFVFFTSGSTGKPKGVTHTLETAGWIIASTAQAWEFTLEDAFLTASSLSHEGGMGMSFGALAGGARVAIARSVDAEELRGRMRAERPTTLWTLPAILMGLLGDPDSRSDDFASLRFCSTGGDKAPAEMERRFAELAGFELQESYGMTEIGCATLTPPSGPNKQGSIGPLCPGYELSIRDADGRELPVGADGRLWIRSPANCIGYWNNAEATTEAIRDGWLDTGDVMHVDEDGYLWFAGRRKQIIVHDGSNISPQEVEEVLLAHPAVASAGVVGVHDLRHGESVRAYVALAAGATTPREAELIAFARERVGYKAPEHVVFLDEMPLTPAGKVDRTALKRRAEAHLQG